VITSAKPVGDEWLLHPKAGRRHASVSIKGDGDTSAVHKRLPELRFWYLAGRVRGRREEGSKEETEQYRNLETERARPTREGSGYRRNGCGRNLVPTPSSDGRDGRGAAGACQQMAARLPPQYQKVEKTAKRRAAEATWGGYRMKGTTLTTQTPCMRVAGLRPVEHDRRSGPLRDRNRPKKWRRSKRPYKQTGYAGGQLRTDELSFLERHALGEKIRFRRAGPARPRDNRASHLRSGRLRTDDTGRPTRRGHFNRR